MVKSGISVFLILITMLCAGCVQSPTNDEISQSETSQTSINDPAADPVGAYLLVIDDLFNQNLNLNNNIEYLAIDCSTMVNLTAEGRARLLVELEKYNLNILDKTMDQLIAEGFITNLSFENGIFFEIKDQPLKASAIVMNAMKWRSGLAAYGWKNRTVTWQNNSWTLDETGETIVS